MVSYNKLFTCCISHEFYKVATQNSSDSSLWVLKIAKEFGLFCSENGDEDTQEKFQEFISSKRKSYNPPVNEGDQCFTFSDVLSAVDSLSSWLRCILDVGDDPNLVKNSLEDFIRKKSDSLLGWPYESERLRSFCYLMYTSGSTGIPKGVCGTEVGLLNRFLWMQGSYPFQKEEILLFKTSISFIDHFQEYLGAILANCTLIIPPLWMQGSYPFQKEEILLSKTFISFIDHLQKKLGAILC